MPLSPKTPTEVKDYGLEWEDALAEGDAISGSAWEVTPTGLVVGDSTVAGTITLARFLEGVQGATYTAINTITTANGETLQGAIQIEVLSPADIAGAGL